MLASGELGSDLSPSVTCIIADGALAEFTSSIATELQIPIIFLQVASACYMWALFSIPSLIENGELPIRGEEDMDKLVNGVPMEGLLRFRDLPSYCRVSDVKDLILQGVVRVYRQCTQGQGLILNTFEELEEPIISHIRPHCPNIYPIGPMHTHLKLKLAKKEVSSQSSNIMTRDELMEFWYGLVNSKKRFLWVIRPDLYKEVEDGKNVPVELLEETKERGYVVGWAPQEEVLDHPAVHSRYVSEAWKIGLDMKDVSDRKVVEKWLKKREGPLKVKEGEIAVHSTSLKVSKRWSFEIGAVSGDPPIWNIHAYLLLKFTMKKSILHAEVHVMDRRQLAASFSLLATSIGNVMHVLLSHIDLVPENYANARWKMLKASIKLRKACSAAASTNRPHYALLQGGGSL
ncbi:hypothetical protein FNV43_RR01178 [Rhamnella rubrinervis]|uniref:Uncharacterized protein n=1 Tax=Rhamnella rubrinervis TaxID=2594499 RepID=A0A8K0HRU2_9ROSA|nr:hypothetical protein FNV43_RR01178 [Rhamnella rubrinervis]